MSDIAHNADYLDDARARLPEQFKNLPRIDGVLQALMAEAQELEDALVDFLVGRMLQNDAAVGDLLDKLGGLVGQQRDGAPDADYAVYIAARIKTNRSDGKRETLLAITTLLVPNAERILFREYIGAVEIEVNELQSSPLIIWRDFLRRAVSSAKSIRFISSSRTKAKVLRRTSVYGGVTTTSAQRRSSVHGGGGTGVFANVFGDA